MGAREWPDLTWIDNELEKIYKVSDYAEDLELVKKIMSGISDTIKSSDCNSSAFFRVEKQVREFFARNRMQSTIKDFEEFFLGLLETTKLEIRSGASPDSVMSDFGCKMIQINCLFDDVVPESILFLTFAQLKTSI